MEPIYVVLFINLVIWAGIFGYLVRLNKHISELKKKIKELSK